MVLGNNSNNRANDRADDIIARRKAADMLAEAKELIAKAKRKTSRTKGDKVDTKLTMLSGDLEDIIFTLRDPDSDPD